MKAEINIESSLPNPKLSDFIKEFFYLRIDSDNKETIVAIDDGCYDFMFFREQKATLQFENSKSVKIDNKVFTVHQVNPPLHYMFGRKVSFFSVKVQPWANSFFFPNHFRHGIVSLDSIYGPEIIELQSNIFKSSSFQEKVQITEEFFTEMKPNIKDDFHLVKQICQHIYENRGMTTVNELSNKFELDRQTLNKTFYKFVNYTIKRFIIIVRIINLSKFKIFHSSA